VPETFLRNELHSLQLWFQQDGTTAYRAHISMQVLRIMLPGRLSSHFGSITCPTRSPDLSSYVATLQARYTKHVIPILLTSNSKFCSIFKGSLRECYIVLRQPSRRDCSRVLNNMVVTYKVSYSNNYDSYEFSWTWNASASVNKYFHFALKFIAIQKPSGVFNAPCISDFDTHFLVHSGPHFKLNGKAVISCAGT
jgi:hypothetical protein